MFRALICPSSGVCDCIVEPTTLAVSFFVCCVLEFGCGAAGVVSGLPAVLQWMCVVKNQLLHRSIWHSYIFVTVTTAGTRHGLFSKRSTFFESLQHSAQT